MCFDRRHVCEHTLACFALTNTIKTSGLVVCLKERMGVCMKGPANGKFAVRTRP